MIFTDNLKFKLAAEYLKADMYYLHANETDVHNSSGTNGTS